MKYTDKSHIATTARVLLGGSAVLERMPGEYVCHGTPPPLPFPDTHFIELYLSLFPLSLCLSVSFCLVYSQKKLSLFESMCDISYITHGEIFVNETFFSPSSFPGLCSNFVMHELYYFPLKKTVRWVFNPGDYTRIRPKYIYIYYIYKKKIF